MNGQKPMANDTSVSRPPSAPLSTTYSTPSTHPLGFSCVKCRSKHRRCDRTRPVCQNCRSIGFEAECSYPSVALPATENQSAQNRITQKIGAPFFGPMFDNPSASPVTGEKRPRVTDSSERTELVNDVVALHIKNHSSHAQQMQTLQAPPANRHRISELDSGSAARQSAPGPAQTSLFGTGMPNGSRSGPPPRSISPTLPQDEMELRCNLTTEINVQRMKHRNLAAGPLRNIVKLLMKAKSERPTTKPTIAGSSGVPFNNEWREEDDLMQVATVKLEKGGRCSRALLSRFENFLYGPLMSPEEKKMQERIICVEECLSSASAPPTADHNALFLHRLKRIILNPDSYGLNQDSRIGFLRNQILAAIATNSKLSGANRKKIAELLDPDGEIANTSADSPGVKTGTPISTRKAPPKPPSPRVPSSHTPETPSRTTTRKKNSVVSLSPSSPHPPLSPLLSFSTTYPPPFPSRSSSLSTPPLEPIDPTDDTMSSSFPFMKPTPRKRVASGSQSSQSNDTAASPSMEPPSKKRPTPGSQSNDTVAPSPKRAASSTQSSSSDDTTASASKRAASSTQSSSSDDTTASASKRAASGTLPSNSNNLIAPATKRVSSGSNSSIPNNIVAPPHRRSAPASQPFSSEIPKRLWNIFVAKHAPMLPILNLDQLKAAFALAVNNGKVGPTVIDPTFGLCIAIACHLIPDKDLWEGRKWYNAALSNMADPFKSPPSIQSFHHQILQIQYLHMVGHLRMAWDVLSLAIGRAQSLRMQSMHGGSLAVDEDSLEQVRMVWQCLWMKKLSLTLQFGVVDQSLDTFYELPMPMQSHIHGNMGVSGTETNEHCHAISSFFVACASLLKYTDDLITVENDLRVTRMECPVKWLSIVDLRGFQELNEKLSSWNNGLPKCLEWKDAGIDFTMKKDPLIRQMCVLAHLRYVYFRLRQHRPFFILTLRLSQTCACEMSPHITGKDIDSMGASPFLGMVYYSAVKCLTAAQDIVKTLAASNAKAAGEHAKGDHLEYLYAAALILIAARMVPFVMNGTQRGLSAAANVAKSVKTMTEELKQIDILLRQYQESCEQAPKLQRRIERSRSVLGQIKLQSESVSSSGIATDNELRFEPVVWRRIYDRLGLDVPFGRFPQQGPPGSSVVTGRRNTLGWLESLPVDMDPEL
ncbi:hypothetical protein N7519_011059 [Penicillium mononematosum]|uniref:uncharacterized protein n=1 Tax=Penicillium mononematosum TaxID=268346 RepID=UPI002546674B|nr:uncharacterized protein N7519_011059 [Penicillium mononematosum]KAJ6180598.1 hypothetical protein N7519_011059 [Penicillium mononematosum]